MMKKTLVLLMALLLLVTLNVYAEEDTSLSTVLPIGIGKYNVTKNEIKKSVVMSLLKRGYKVQHISKEKYTATHHRKPVSINVNVSETKIVVLGSSGIKPKWVANIHKDIVFWLEYYTLLKRSDG